MLDEQLISKGEVIHHVRNADLAVALVSVGIPLWKTRPYFDVVIRGNRVITWNFPSCSPDKELETLTLIRAWKDDVAFIKAHPNHPFSYALMTLKNLRRFQEHHEKDTPFNAYRLPGVPLNYFAKPGSKREALLLSKGYKQI